VIEAVGEVEALDLLALMFAGAVGDEREFYAVGSRVDRRVRNGKRRRFSLR
jgi:hypothetical protein